MSDTLLQIVVLVPCLVIAIVFHEVAHGWAALALGDPTAKERRRLTLNPLRHVDPIGTLVVPGFLALVGGPVFGWAKPVPVNKWRLKNPRFGMMAVAAAGPLTNLVLAAGYDCVYDSGAIAWTHVRAFDALHLTVSTVEFHLSKTYAKLEIRSRAQLGARLAPRS